MRTTSHFRVEILLVKAVDASVEVDICIQDCDVILQSQLWGHNQPIVVGSVCVRLDSSAYSHVPGTLQLGIDGGWPEFVHTEYACSVSASSVETVTTPRYDIFLHEISSEFQAAKSLGNYIAAETNERRN
jgi:hypothetical protein